MVNSELPIDNVTDKLIGVEIISIGEELLSGDSEIIDTNSIFLTKQMRAIGLRVLYKTTVGDDEQRITDVIRLALSRAEVVITTGGLGPTVDDMTRQGVANAVGQKLILRDDLLEELAAKFVAFGSRMSDNNRMQAVLPEHAEVIKNPVGTAPGFIVEYEGHYIFSVPGVPREMKVLVENTVVPYLKAKFGDKGVFKTRVLRTAGIGESLLDEQVGEFEKLTNPVVGLAAHSGQTDIRIYARAASEADADALIASVEAKIRERVGEFIYGVEKEPLEQGFDTALSRLHKKVAIVEAATDNALKRRIESQPGGADLIAFYESYATAEGLAAAYGAANVNVASSGTENVSDSSQFKTIAEQAAQAARQKSGADIGIAIVTETNGTAIAVISGNNVRSRTYGYGGTALGGPEWATGWALSIGWHLLTSTANTEPR